MTPGGVRVTAYFSQKRHSPRAVITPSFYFSGHYLADGTLRRGLTTGLHERIYVS